MHPCSLFAGLAFAAIAAGAPVPASARLADVSIIDRRDGRELPVHWHDGRRYVVGEPGREYEIRVRNRSGGRVLAVTSVDGVNVLSGETASAAQSGYVVDAHDHVRIDGWRKNLSEVAAFYFTRLPDAYAARTGRPGDVGVIGVALFREKAVAPPAPPPVPCCRPWHREWDEGSAAADDAASGAPQARAEAETRSDRAQAPPSTSSLGAAAPQKKKAERIGTGHGARLDSAAQRVAFERASDTPEEVIAIWYDTRANLVAQGVLPRPPKPPRAPREPNPFPAWEPGFVPDP